MTASPAISPAVKLSVRRIGDGQTVIGSTEAVMEFLGLSPQHNEHCKAYRWHRFMMPIQPDYLEEIAKRQAYKRSIGK